MTPIKSVLLALLAVLALAPASAAAQERAMTPDPLSYVSPSRPFDTIHTSLELDVDLKGQRVAGSVTHTMRSLRPGLVEVPLNCVGLVIEGVWVNGEPADYDYPVPNEHATSWIGALPESESNDLIVIKCNEPVARDAEFTVKIQYHGTPKKGLYWVAPEKGLPDKRYEVWSQGEGEDNRYWIPCHDYPNDKATFEGRFRVDPKYYALSNGELVSRTERDGRVEYYWKLATPQVSYLITLAVAEYTVYEEDWNGVPLLYVVPPGTGRATVDRGYGLTADMMDFFTKTIGIDYPFEKYAQVVVQNFIYGGMENTSATTMNIRTLFDERWELTNNEDGLVAHELAHQWWGDMVTCREWSHMWLNEGFATYYQALYRQHHEGDDAFRWEVRRRHRGVVERDDRDARPVVVDFYNRKDARNNSNIYIKGSSVLHMLRFLLGDALYHEVIRTYGERRKFDVAETADLMRAVKDVTGENYDWFFEQWIFLSGHPKLKVSKYWDAKNKRLEMTVRQTQKVEGQTPLFRLPVDVEITCEEKTEIYRITIDDNEQTFYFSLPSAPKMVIFDKGDWTLKTLSFPKRTHELLYQLEHGDYMARVRAAEALGEKGDAGVEALRAVMLAGGHWGLRREAALALGEIGSGAARDALYAGLDVDAGRVRLAVAEALGKFRGDEDAAGKLVSLMNNDPAWEVRARAVTSLVQMRSERAVEACKDALRQESFRSVVRNAGLDGLAELDETDALATIKRYTTAGNDRWYRHNAIAAYAKLAKHLESERDRERAAAHLASMLDDWYIRTRQAVIRGIVSLGEKSALDDLERVASGDPLDNVRRQARRAATALAAKTAKSKTEQQQEEIEDLKHEVEELSEQVKELKKKLPEEPESDE